MPSSMEEIKGRLARSGYTVVDPNTVTDAWLKENDVLCCKGDMFWYLLKNSRENRVIKARWEKERAA